MKVQNLWVKMLTETSINFVTIIVFCHCTPLIVLEFILTNFFPVCLDFRILLFIFYHVQQCDP
jgi:hypothetical protein